MRQTNEEIRREVLADDDKRDISIYVSVPIGIVAGIAAMGGVCAVIMMRALVYFRAGVDAHWLTCVPFIFPAITGLFAAYKKQFSLLGVHLATLVLALLFGGFGFGMAVEPLFFNRHDCIPDAPGLPCDKDSLAYLYMASGCVASGFTVLGFLMTLCGLNSANKRMNAREEEMERQHLEQVEKHQAELRQKKMDHDRRPRTFSKGDSAPAAAPAPNGVALTQVSSEQPKTAEGDNVTTKL